MAEKQNNAPWILIGLFGILAWDKIFADSKDDKAGEKFADTLDDLPLEENPFNVAAFKLPIKKDVYRYTINTTTATKAASKVNAGIGVVSDDEAMIVDGIKTAKTRADLHFIAAMYSRVYKRDMLTDLKKNLAKKTELGLLIAKYVLKLPKYVTKGIKQ